jgi:hypothetical protein
VNGTSYLFTNPAVGKWNLYIKSKDGVDKSRLIAMTNVDTPQAIVILWNQSPIKYENCSSLLTISLEFTLG